MLERPTVHAKLPADHGCQDSVFSVINRRQKKSLKHYNRHPKASGTSHQQSVRGCLPSLCHHKTPFGSHPTQIKKLRSISFFSKGVWVLLLLGGLAQPGETKKHHHTQFFRECPLLAISLPTSPPHTNSKHYQNHRQEPQLHHQHPHSRPVLKNTLQALFP